MDEEIHKQFFPMKLPLGVVARSMDPDAAHKFIEAINHLIFPADFKQTVGLFEVPEARHESLERLRKLHTRSSPEWLVFFNGADEPIGWFLGYMEDEETFFIDTIGFIPTFRGQGIYSAFLRQFIVYLRAMGYERLTTSHGPNVRAALIADLKMGFDIVGIELNEGHGVLVKTAYHLHEDRRQAFERVFSTPRESTNEMDKSASTKISRKLSSESRIEHISDDVGSPEKEILSLLQAAMGGDDTPPWPANQRWLLWFSDKLMGHVSVQRRWFVVNKHYLEGWHVGGVCVHPSIQRNGIGTFLMEQAHADLSSQELEFAVLNCGRHLVRFYERVGYTKVSDRALYIRDSKLAIDEDPALVISFRKCFDITVLMCDAFPFGFDF